MQVSIADAVTRETQDKEVCSVSGSCPKTSAVLIPGSMIRGSSLTANHHTRN